MQTNATALLSNTLKRHDELSRNKTVSDVSLAGRIFVKIPVGRTSFRGLRNKPRSSQSQQFDELFSYGLKVNYWRCSKWWSRGESNP